MGTSLVVQWLRLHASTAGGTGSIPGGGTKIPHATQPKKEKEEEEKERRRRRRRSSWTKNVFLKIGQ